MREDWNARAREDAGYYVAFGRRDQDDEEFFASASDVVRGLETELRRVPAEQRTHWKALEIGCGPGRLMRPMSRHFVEIHGIDVSDEMVERAKSNLQNTPNAFVHVGDGSRLSQFADASIDFVYSYAVFQHIPSRAVVLEYLDEVHRVLKPGGFARLQLNGLPLIADDQYTTWSGARFSPEELLEFTAQRDLQVLALEGTGTQYMWTTWRKQEQGWNAQMRNRTFSDAPARIRRITNAVSSVRAATRNGRFASISMWVENLPDNAGLHHLRVTIDQQAATVVQIGSAGKDGVSEIFVNLPDLNATGLLPVELRWMGMGIAPRTVLRIMEPGPTPPRVRSVTDGINILAEQQTQTRLLRITVEELNPSRPIAITLGETVAEDIASFCIDPRQRLYEVTCKIPDSVAPGYHNLHLKLGRQTIGPVQIAIER